MFPEERSFPKIPDNSKAGITVCLNQNNDGEPFEATVYFKKSGKNSEELRDEKAVVLTASGKLRLDLGKNAFVEIFAENTNKVKDIDAEEAASFKEEPDGTMSLL
jgi:hypothetical protein